jgi:nucleoid-associated protein YgaU
MSIKFTPLPSGSWGVRVFGSDARLFRRGDQVRVVKSNGEEKAVTLDTMVAGEGTDTETWSIVETRPVGGRAPRAYGRGRAPASKPTGQRLDLGDVVLAASETPAAGQEITTVGRGAAPVAPTETDEATIARLLVDGSIRLPAYAEVGA